MSVLDFPYFAKSSCFFSGAKYSAIFWKKLEVNDLFFYAIPGQRDLAAAKIDIKSKKTTRS